MIFLKIFWLNPPQRPLFELIAIINTLSVSQKLDKSIISDEFMLGKTLLIDFLTQTSMV